MAMLKVLPFLPVQAILVSSAMLHLLSVASISGTAGRSLPALSTCAIEFPFLTEQTDTDER
jgi:hypothetical protein